MFGLDKVFDKVKDTVGQVAEKAIGAPAGVFEAGLKTVEAAAKGDLKGAASAVTSGVNALGPLVPGGPLVTAGINTANALIQGEDPIKSILTGAGQAFPQFAPVTGLVQQLASGNFDPSAILSTATQMNILPPGVGGILNQAAPIIGQLATSKDPAGALLQTFGGPAAGAVMQLLPQELQSFGSDVFNVFQKGGGPADLLGPATSMVGNALGGDLGPTIFGLANNLQQAGLVSLDRPDQAIKSAVNILLGSTVQGLGQLSLPGGFAGGPNLLDHTN